MIDIIVKRLKTNMAQHTSLFDIKTMVGLSAIANKNVLTVDGLDGEYTLSGASDGVASAGCVNDTNLFDKGVVTTECYYGENQKIPNLTAHKVNVGTAFDRDTAIKLAVDVKLGNSIIVYMGEAKNASNYERSTISQDLSLKVEYTIGVLFKVDAKDMGEIKCLKCDPLFINSVVACEKHGATLLEFKHVQDRFYSGDNYIVDMVFGYTDEMFVDSDFLKTLKYFEASLNIKTDITN